MMLAFENDPCDPRMLGTSPIFSKDYFTNSLVDFCPPYYEEDIAAEVNVQCESISANSSCGTSVTSEFSEDSFFDNDDEDFLPFGESKCTSLNFEPLEQFSNVMHENSDLEDEEVLSFNNKGEFDSKKRNKNSIKSECGCCELRKRMAGLSWNKMSSNNQMESIEYLTKVVSTTLGLREQLDVIRIISPEATVSATDTEFFIDLETFNDDKFQRLKQYINEHLLDDECKKCSESRKKRCQYKITTSPQKFSQKRKTQKPLSTKRVSKKSRKSKGLLSRIHRQMEKEKRSGLFDKEEVLSVSRKSSLPECEEEIEVDILC